MDKLYKYMTVSTINTVRKLQKLLDMIVEESGKKRLSIVRRENAS